MKLQYPIILVHGYGARPRFGPVEYFYGVSEYLKKQGNQVFAPTLRSWGSLEDRTQELITQVQKRFGTTPVHLIGHSFGGLDSLWAAQNPDFRTQIRSISLIGTPYHGTPVADFVLSRIPMLNHQNLGVKTLSKNHSIERIPLPESIPVFSLSTYIEDPSFQNSLPFFWLPHAWIKKQEGDNDGFVSLDSARVGTWLGSYPGDHYAQIGQFLGRNADRSHLKFFEIITTRLKQEEDR